MDAKEKESIMRKTSEKPNSNIDYVGYDSKVVKDAEQAKRSPNRNCLG